MDDTDDISACFFQENRDGRKLSPMLELLIDNPISGNGGSSADTG